MRGYFVLCFVLAMVGLAQTVHLHWLSGKKGRTGPHRPRPLTMKYCRVSTEITTFLKQLRSIGKDGVRGQKGSAGFRSRHGSSNWVYNCLHVGYNFQDRIFELPKYQCCKKCEWPGFSQCLRRYRHRSVAQSRCNSEALRCIAKCICKKDGRRKAGKSGQQKCPVKRKRSRSSYCLERSCIRV